ncbi:S-layer homology domain-containing protein [Paenibacillus rhizovicinus]|uniref:S-layer homology domain-containing protein n=1 Tax=Paenibacillus rhizovicinus TaxID=2704463 RepID=A0A6C0P281_9BACL|nr:S-layer homology domain-containing protein [Paenibacillus rhizovicinus]QHW32577.1 S-layer homology domain-containing protein [Paenibacillus rhizovicinus]
MRQTSKQYSKQNSQEPKVFRGGEKKVMKKSLSLVVAAAMTLTTASVAFADAAAPTATDLTSQQKFDALKELGIFSGYPGGDAGLDKEMTRAEFAKVLTKLSQLEENAAAAKVYTDVPATHWAVGFVGAVTEAKIMNGMGNNKFVPSGKVSIEQIAKVADLVAGVEPIADAEVAGTVSGWAKGYVAAAIKAGLLPELPSYQTNATRDLLVNVTYDLAEGAAEATVASTKVVDATHIEVTFSDAGVVKKELTTALVAGVATKVSVDYNGKSYEVEVTLPALKATEAAQTGAKKVTVKFNQAVSAADQKALTYELKSGLTTFPVTATFAADGQSAVLAAAYLPAGDYALTVKGSDAINLKVEAEGPKKIDIGATSIQNAANQDLGVKVYNQFGEEYTSSPQITAVDITSGFSAASNTNTIDLSDSTKFKIGDSFAVTAVLPSAGLSANKVLKITNGSAATVITLGQVQPQTGDSRIVVKDGYVLPLSMVDADGKAVKLPINTTIDLSANTKSAAGLVFYSSDAAIVKELKVDSNGVVKFNALKSGTVYLTVTNPATGANAAISVVVNASAAISTFQLGNSGSLIVQNEKVVLPFTAVDQFGAPIAAKDANITADKVTFNAFGVPVVPTKNAKGELEFTFTQTGSTTIYVYVNGVLQANPVSISVQPAKWYTAVDSIHDVATTYEVGASNDFDATKIKIQDNYGRVSDITGGVTVTSSDNGIVSVANGKLTGVAAGTATITVKSNIAGNVDKDGKAVAIADYTFDVTVVKSSDIKSYAIDTIATLYGNSDAAKVVGHEKAVTLVGKTAGGTTVALVNNVPTFVVSSDVNVLTVAGNGTSVAGVKAGKATVSAYYNGSKVSDQEVTVSEEAPVAKTVEFDKDEYTTVNDVVTPVVTVKDQYGIVIANPNGLILFTDNIATYDAATKEITATTASASTTITYITSNGVQDTAVLVTNA